VGFDWERGEFRRGHSLHNDKVRRAPRWTGQIQAGRGGRLIVLGVPAGVWRALPCGCAPPPPRNETAPLQDEDLIFYAVPLSAPRSRAGYKITAPRASPLR
jgi:hypothetical protein